MTAKEYLLQLKRIMDRIENIEEQKEHIMSVVGIKAIDYTADKVRSSSDSDRMTSAIAKCIEIEKELCEEKEHYIKIYRRIMQQINSLDDQRYVDILRLRYAEGKRLEEISCIMRKTNGEVYNYDYIKQLHGWALESFSRKYQNLTAI